jgi:hypothetical protein
MEETLLMQGEGGLEDRTIVDGQTATFKFWRNQAQWPKAEEKKKKGPSYICFNLLFISPYIEDTNTLVLSFVL